MPFIVLIAAPQSEALRPCEADCALDPLRAFGLKEDRQTLADNEALIVETEAGTRGEIEETVQAALSGGPVDVAVMAGRPAPRRLLIADMDSTIITCECIDELAAAVGLKGEVSAITERAMRGEIEFESALRERVALLKGLPVARLQEVFDTAVHLTPGARTLVRTMNAAGAVTALISGGFTFFTSRVAERAGFAHNQGNTLHVAEGLLTGTVAEPILGRAAKREALERLSSDNGISISDTLAVGDGANDLDMISRAGLGVAFHAKPKVAAAAPVSIRHGDLTALLYLQGFSKDRFAD